MPPTYFLAASGPIWEALSESDQLTSSEFLPGVEPGDFLNGIQCQDVTRLTFESESFKIVASEHVLEHVSSARNAFSEMSRVLMKGGLLVFSIPFEGESSSVIRAQEDGSPILPYKYHKDPLRNEGVLVYTDFCRDDFIQTFIEPFGLEGRITEVEVPDAAINRSSVVVCRKP